MAQERVLTEIRKGSQALALGLFLDEIGIILLCVPIFLPIITALGFDPVWFGILFLINAHQQRA